MSLLPWGRGCICGVIWVSNFESDISKWPTNPQAEPKNGVANMKKNLCIQQHAGSHIRTTNIELIILL